MNRVLLLLTAEAPVGNAALPAESPLDGFFWTVVVPALLLAGSVAATWALYRHFASKGS